MADLPSWVRKGVKVICIRDFREARTVDDLGYTSLPTRGDVYTIVTTIHAYGQIGIVLAEFEPDHYFDLRGFRPLVTRTLEQDLSIFAPLLKTELERV